jgi:hypothetical protein
MAANAFPFGRVFRCTAFVAGVAGILVGCGLLLKHIDAFGPKRDLAVLIGSALPELRSRVALLEANVEAERLFGIEKQAAREEQAAAYILPDEPDGARTVSVLQETAAALSAAGAQIDIKSIAFDREAVTADGVRQLHGKITLNGRSEHVSRLLTGLGFSGDLSVRDALPPEKSREFLAAVEKDSPLSLPGAEEFLFSDLVAYAADPDAAEQRVTRDMQPEVAANVRTILLAAGLADVRASLSAVAPRLKQQRLWPMPLLRVDSLTQENGGEWIVGITVFGRE